MITVYDTIEQGTPEWCAARAGIPTASEFGAVISKGRGAEPSKTRRTYMLKLAGERITGEVVEGYSNAHMERGKVMEDEARDLYVFMRDIQVQRVGFIRHDVLRAGVSPDSLIGDDGMLEVKTKLPHLQLEVLLDGTLPAEHKAQVQGAMLVSGRAWCDFVSYWPKLPPLIVRVERDETYIDTLRTAIQQFHLELDELVARFT